MHYRLWYYYFIFHQFITSFGNLTCDFIGWRCLVVSEFTLVSLFRFSQNLRNDNVNYCERQPNTYLSAMQQLFPHGLKREKFIMVVLGREWGGGSDFYSAPTHCQRIENGAYVIISTPDYLNDSDILDLIALSDSKPNVFLMEEGKNPQEELQKWEKIFGKEIVDSMICITDKEHPFDNRFLNKFINKKDIERDCSKIHDQKIRGKYNFTRMLERRKMARIDEQQGFQRPSSGMCLSAFFFLLWKIFVLYNIKHYVGNNPAGFVQFEENWKSHGIWKRQFPGQERSLKMKIPVTRKFQKNHGIWLMSDN